MLKEILCRKKKKDSISFSLEDIICDEDIIDCISKWAAEENWGFMVFPYLLKSARGQLKTPIRLSKLNGESFTCITGDDEQFVVKLVHGSFFDCTMFYIIDKNVVNKYDVGRFEENGKFYPKATLSQKTIKIAEKELSCFLSKHFLHRSLDFSDNLTLKLDMDYSSKNSYKPNKRNMDILNKNVDDYLLSLEYSESISTKIVWENIVKILNLSNSDIEALSKVIVVLTEKGENEIEKSKYVLVDSKCEEYAETVDGATYHVYADGSWKYCDNDSKLVYLENENNFFKYFFSTTVIQNKSGEIESVQPEKIIEKSKNRITEMQKVLN